MVACWAAGENSLLSKTPPRQCRRRTKRLAAKQPVVVVEVVVKPVPVLVPTVAVPVDIGNVVGVVRVTLKNVQ